MRRVIGRPLKGRMLLTEPWLAETMSNGSRVQTINRVEVSDSNE